MQRIGVFVCHCGSNIAATVDVKKVVELAAKEPGVVHAEDYQYMCSEAGQAKIQEAIKEKNLTGVVVCSCSPRMHEATFRKAAERAGLNPYMVEIANIREHCSWIHKDMEEATKKAVILARAAIAKVNLNAPLQPGESRVTKRALIIGGGIAGIQTALDIADAGYEVDIAYDGLDGYLKIKENAPQLVLLDWMLPNISGIDMLKKIRNDKSLSDIPVIMLTAKNMESDKIEGLELGADDYITKPFSIKELLARVSSVLRRYNINKENVENVLTVGSLNVNLLKHEVFKGNEKIDLTLKEFELLKLLLENKGKVLSRNYLLDKIWGYDYYGETRTVDVHIRYLRKKIEGDNSSEKYIQTIRGVGYKID